MASIINSINSFKWINKFQSILLYLSNSLSILKVLIKIFMPKIYDLKLSKQLISVIMKLLDFQAAINCPSDSLSILIYFEKSFFNCLKLTETTALTANCQAL